MPVKKVVIVPGNGAGEVEHSNWYGWLNKQIKQVCRVETCYKHFIALLRGRVVLIVYHVIIHF